jgi:hypothetical protein
MWEVRAVPRLCVTLIYNICYEMGETGTKLSI